MTRITAVAPADPDTPCPIWCRFVDRITGGDAALAFYLQRLAGYALTGQTVEHALFLAHGPGANGKSVFMDTLARILGDYADVASLDALAAPSGAEIACLAGARLVTAEDLGEGRAFPLARLKALAAGGKVAARLGRNQTVAVTPRFKLLIAGNERPSLDRFDEATRRRLHLVPFAVTIPEDERDPFPLEKLAPELPAILRWAIDGAVAWRKLGLAPPEAVRDARARHVAAEDSLGQWLDDCAEVAQGNWESASALYASWCAWAAAAGEDAGSQKRFSQLLEGRGFTPKRRRTGHRGFLGLWLGAPMPEDADNPSSAFAREANEGCRAEARKGEGGLVHDEQRRDTSPVIASQPSPTEGGRGCERSERVRAGAVLHADAPRLPEAPSHALTLPSPRGPFGKSSGGPLPLPPSAGEGLVRKTRHHASSVRALSACP